MTYIDPMGKRDVKTPLELAVKKFAISEHWITITYHYPELNKTTAVCKSCEGAVDMTDLHTIYEIADKLCLTDCIFGNMVKALSDQVSAPASDGNESGGRDERNT